MGHQAIQFAHVHVRKLSRGHVSFFHGPKTFLICSGERKMLLGLKSLINKNTLKSLEM